MNQNLFMEALDSTIENEKLLFTTKTMPYQQTEEENFHLLVLNLQNELKEIISDFNQVNN